MEAEKPTATSSRTLLLAEFSVWSKSHRAFISVVGNNISDDGRIRLRLCVDESKMATLFCPSNYPLKSEDNFFFEAYSKDLQTWCNDINEFIVESDGELALADVLNKAVHLYRPIRSVSPYLSQSDSEELFENICDEYIAFTDEEDSENQTIRCKIREIQRKLEADRRKSTGKPRESSKLRSSGLFSDTGASGVLINHLVDIIKSRKETGINVDAIDNNIYKWCVCIGKFDKHTDLRKDMKELQELCGYNCIEFHLDFTKDLYPFYPPTVQMIRPRLKSMVGNFSGMNALSLANWNPICTMKDVLLTIKAHMSQWARVEFDTARNYRHVYLHGSYSLIENYLLFLAWVSETAPPAIGNDDTDASTDDATDASTDDTALDLTKKVSKVPSVALPDATDSQGSSLHRNWNIHQQLAAQREKDKQTELVLKRILDELKAFNANYSGKRGRKTARSSEANERRCPAAAIPSCSTTDSTSSISEETISITSPSTTPIEDLLMAIQESSLVPFLQSKLETCTFREMSRQGLMYRHITDIMTQLASQPLLKYLTDAAPHLVQSLYKFTRNLDEEACGIVARSANAHSRPAMHVDWRRWAGHEGNCTRDSAISCTPKEILRDNLARDFRRMSEWLGVAVKKCPMLEDVKSNPECQNVAGRSSSVQSSAEGVKSLGAI